MFGRNKLITCEDVAQVPHAEQLHVFVVVQEISCQHADLLSLHPPAVRTCSLASLQQPGGIHLLEEALLHLAPAEPPSKRIRGRTHLPPDTLRWMELAKYGHEGPLQRTLKSTRATQNTELLWQEMNQ